MKIQETSEDFTEGGIFFPGFKTAYMEANTQNDGKNEEKGVGMHSHAPRAW